LFENESDLTTIQLSFLQWLEIYNSLEMDLAMKEKGISRKVIEDDYRVDAYLYYKNLNDKTKEANTPKEGYEPPVDIPSVMFKRGK